VVSSTMTRFRSLLLFLASDDLKLRRLIDYWAITAALYILCVSLLWFEVWLGAVELQQATWLSLGIMSGSLVFYCLIRTSTALGLTPSQLAFSQGIQAIVCIVAAYAIATPVRGAVLTLLLVVLVFCAFALTARRAHQITAFAILTLAGTMLWLVHVDPQRHTRDIEAVHFTLASSMSAAVVYLTTQFNRLRGRLKAQKTELEQQKSELSEAVLRIEQIAKRDELTLLPNRRYMKEVLSKEEKRHSAESKMLCLALLDIDHFKTLNDTYGHAAGDEVLYNFSQQVQATLRDHDVLARWGGEEFLLLLPNTDQNAAMVVLERVQKSLLDVPLKTSDVTLGVTFSAGFAVMSPGETVTEAIRRADKAMYRAKAAGRNTSRQYDPEMEAAITAYEQLKVALVHGIQSGQLVLHYQPQVKADGTITGAEALVRWQHPQKGLIYPGDFISIAEESDMIIALGQWVLTAACEQLAEWAKHKETAHLDLAVNVSARQLRHPDFVQHALAVMVSAGIDPRRLKIELTESMLVDDVEGAIAKMNTLKSAGVSFSLDDFGTGYSSLSYLKRLPLDQVKIDQSFVSGIQSDSEDGIIARAVISLAHGLGFSVIAEGVETASQLDFLTHHGCSDFQGYFFGRPVPIQAFESFLAGKNASRRLKLMYDPVTAPV
jgi:diguanylate cyclase (GGDEF)-like protein